MGSSGLWALSVGEAGFQEQEWGRDSYWGTEFVGEQGDSNTTPNLALRVGASLAHS